MPVWRTPYPFAFQADAYADSSNAVNEAELMMPDSSRVQLSWDPVHSYRPTGYSFRSNFVSAQSLEDAYTNGTYTFLLDTAHDGNRVVDLDLVAPDYPNTPWVSNFDDAQKVRADSDFTLQWNSFAGGVATDSITVEIWSDPSTRVFTTPGDPTPGDSQFSWTNRSVIIPRNTLQDGQTYVVFLVFLRITYIDEVSYPGVRCVAGCDSYTIFSLHTLPRLHIGLTNQIATLSWPYPSARFALQANADIGQPGGWLAITNTPVLVSNSHTLTLPATNRAQCYRLIRN